MSDTREKAVNPASQANPGWLNDSLLGGLFLQIFTIIFLISGGLLSLIGLLFESYRLWPINEMTPLVVDLVVFDGIILFRAGNAARTVARVPIRWNGDRTSTVRRHRQDNETD